MPIDKLVTTDWTDSYGAPLPKYIDLVPSASQDEIAFANATNSFIRFAQLLRKQGEWIRYEPDTKTLSSFEDGKWVRLLRLHT